MLQRNEAEKYQVFSIEDEYGHSSAHYAETKERAIQAHLTHWGLRGLTKEPKIVSIQSFMGAVCSDAPCVESANIPDYVKKQLFG